MAHSPLRRLFLSLALTAAAGAAPGSAAGQEAHPAPYTAAQAEAGRETYQAVCAACHMPDLAGRDDAPPLTDAYFASSWGGYPVSTLLEFVEGNMPLTAPGSLNEEDYVAVVAYLLSMNGAPAGDTPLTMGAAGVIASGER